MDETEHLYKKISNKSEYKNRLRISLRYADNIINQLMFIIDEDFIEYPNKEIEYIQEHIIHKHILHITQMFSHIQNKEYDFNQYIIGETQDSFLYLDNNNEVELSQTKENIPEITQTKYTLNISNDDTAMERKEKILALLKNHNNREQENMSIQDTNKINISKKPVQKILKKSENDILPQTVTLNIIYKNDNKHKNIRPKGTKQLWEKVHETVLVNSEMLNQSSKDECLNRIINIRKQLKLLNQEEIVYYYEYYNNKIIPIENKIKLQLKENKNRLRRLKDKENICNTKAFKSDVIKEIKKIVDIQMTNIDRFYKRCKFAYNIIANGLLDIITNLDYINTLKEMELNTLFNHINI